MTTQKENSHTDKTKTRRYTFAQKEGEEHSCVKLTEGKYKDVIYHYGRVAFAPESEKQPDGKLPMKFDYTIDKNPNNLILIFEFKITQFCSKFGYNLTYFVRSSLQTALQTIVNRRLGRRLI